MAWSGRRQATVNGVTAGDRTDYTFAVAADGEYAMNLALTKAPAYAGVTFEIDGNPVGSYFDGQAPHVHTGHSSRPGSSAAVMKFPQGRVLHFVRKALVGLGFKNQVVAHGPPGYRCRDRRHGTCPGDSRKGSCMIEKTPASIGAGIQSGVGHLQVHGRCPSARALTWGQPPGRHRATRGSQLNNGMTSEPYASMVASRASCML